MEQLKREHAIDSKLEKLDCQETVLEYFRLYRAWNRAAFTKPHSNLWRYRIHAKGIMDHIDTQYNRLEKTLDIENRYDLCKGLESFNQWLTREIENDC